MYDKLREHQNEELEVLQLLWYILMKYFSIIIHNVTFS